jgi:hypothetical protein
VPADHERRLIRTTPVRRLIRTMPARRLAAESVG